jgi:hypothetical protein
LPEEGTFTDRFLVWPLKLFCGFQRARAKQHEPAGE